MKNPLAAVGTYPERVVGRDDVGEIVISTAWTSDEGFETAILDGTGVAIVERYKTQILAARGHEKWIGKIRNKIKVVPDLGWSDIPEMDSTYKVKYEDKNGD